MNNRQANSALSHLRSALELLDAADAPGHIGAHIDLAICQLEEALPANTDETKPKQLRYGNER